ncbi:RNA polymerase sigma factor sigD, chloroplastic [Mercurialis annua]|uniref:RNA polymerase sigma factor sigD, chloroplastic n=1 Tax=Mercurialis annua TaxID=3986 RepID=UPI00215F6340|nr:RNA polymerase sigma factor sigD, chloroplastic [Mercurialis annua]
MAITTATAITIPSLKLQHPSLQYSSLKLTAAIPIPIPIISTETVSISAETVALPSAAVQAVEDDVVARRKKRRKRRRGLVQILNLEGERDDQCQKTLFQCVDNNRFLSSVEEAELCICLKDQARLEAARTRIADTQETEPNSKQLANALRTRKESVDKISCRGRQSRERIIRNYRRLVVSIAISYQGKGLSLKDLVQEGSIGLIRGAERFDPRRGNKLSTYVYWWIKEAIMTSISNKSRIVRVPGSLRKKMKKIAEAKISLTKRLGRLPSCDEIAKELNVNVSTVLLGFMRSKTLVSLDIAVSDQGGMTLQEIMPGPEEMTPENMVKKQQLKQELDELIIERLDEREAFILRLMFGLNGETPQSCDEIGRSLKLTRERIRQINSIALSKLRHRTVIENLKVYIV